MAKNPDLIILQANFLLQVENETMNMKITLIFKAQVPLPLFSLKKPKTSKNI